MKNIITIGRTPECDIVVDAQWSTVSKHHAEIKREGNELVFVDHSTNGSYVNGVRIVGDSCTIRHGDEIVLADGYILAWSLIDEHFPPAVHRPTVRFDADDILPIADPAPQTPSGRATQTFGGDGTLTPTAAPHTGGLHLRVGDLFHNRYKLISELGTGATADVWKASDTKVNGMVVALKVFASNNTLDSVGLANFKREFQAVYTMKHANLLPPTGYDVCNGRPYLVIPYQENGSCGNLAAKMNEKDILCFLHDVAAGLEALHSHNVIHQDIKPDNILIDDQCRYVVTDFGISVAAVNNESNDRSVSGGTQAYMGPERFDGQNLSASDIWSLGATAVELLTGNPPYGEHGGLLQTTGEPLPQLPHLQPAVKRLILACLDKDPVRRPQAAEIRQKIERYQETGSWVKRGKRAALITMAFAALVVIAAGIWVWDYNRLKVTYYKDYVEYWGVPKGIFKLSSREVAHREASYRIETSKRKVRRIAYVNSAGKVVAYTDAENTAARFSDVRIFYTDNGNVDYKTIYDSNGKILYKMDYDENLKTVTLRQNDEYGTEMNLPSNVNQLYRTTSIIQEQSHISRYLLQHDENGLLTERRYAGLQNVPACDKDNIYGERYRYDQLGRKIEVVYLGRDGKPTCNKDGLSKRHFACNENGDWISATYLNLTDGNSHGGNNCALVKFKHDRWGNRIEEAYFTLQGKPAVRKDMGVSVICYEYNEKGNRIKMTFYDVQGELARCNSGCVGVEMTYDERGFLTSNTYVDEQHNPVMISNDGETYAIEHYEKNETGQTTKIAYLDENGNPSEQSKGDYLMKCLYDEVGNLTFIQFYDKENRSLAIDGRYNQLGFLYDEFNRCTQIAAYDREGKRAMMTDTYSYETIEYNRDGTISKDSYFDKEGKLVCADDGYAYVTYTYDAYGNETKIQLYDENGNLCPDDDGDATIETVYNQQNLRIEKRNFNKNNELTSTYHWDYDEHGRTSKFYTTVDGKLEYGSSVINYEYDENNRVLLRYSTNLQGTRIKEYGENYCEIRYVYDEWGNQTEVSFWNVNGMPTVDDNKVHRSVNSYNEKYQMVVRKNYGTDGKFVSAAGTIPETHYTYDIYGNNTKMAYYDGKGNRFTDDGYDCATATYDLRGNKTKVQYFRQEKCIRQEFYAYNKRNNLTEERICDGNGKLDDSRYGISRLTIDYDELGILATMRRYYTADGKLMLTEVWNKEQKKWETQKTAYSGGGSSTYGSSNWQSLVYDDASGCPIEGDESVIQSFTYTNTSVTVTIRYLNLSKYDLGNITDSDFRENLAELRKGLRERWCLPSNVTLYFYITDKASRHITTLSY